MTTPLEQLADELERLKTAWRDEPVFVRRDECERQTTEFMHANIFAIIAALRLASKAGRLETALEEEIAKAWEAGLGAAVGHLTLPGGRPGRTLDDDGKRYAARRIAALKDQS